MNPMGQARALYAARRLREAASILDGILAADALDAEAMQLLGAIRFQLGAREQGRKLVKQAVAIDPANSEGWNALGLIQHLSGLNEDALASFRTAVDANSRNGEAWMNGGFVLQELGRHNEASTMLQEALAVGFSNPQVHLFLGNAYAALGRPSEALVQFDTAIGLATSFSLAWNNRGNALWALGKAEEAIASFRQAIALDPSNTAPFPNLAEVLRALNRGHEFLELLDSSALPVSTDIDLSRARVLVDLQRHADAAQVLENTLARDGANADVLVDLAKIKQHQGYWREALAILGRSSDPAVQVLRAVTLPVILEDADQIVEALDHLTRSVTAIRSAGFRLHDPLADVRQTTFYLSYYNVSERPYQESVAAMYRDIYPGLDFVASHTPGKHSRIKIGVVSANLQAHSVSLVFGGLIERLDRERFEVVFLQIGKPDSVSSRLAKSVEKHVRLSNSFYESIGQIASEELDVVLYPDIGMNAHSNYLAFARLAPVQCVTWGHPFTTGSPTMDYYISSQHLEREDGDMEYTEQLIRLQSLLSYFPAHPTPRPFTRSEFGLPEDRHLYACLQNLFKFHPDYDQVLAEILERDEKGLLVLPESEAQHWKEILLDRWNRFYPILARRSIFLPRMNQEKYLGLSLLCDAYLAPIQFGGGRSTLDVFSVGVPVVTYKGRSMKSRITYAAYKEIGFEYLVAETEEDYVALAIRLASDSDWRAQMRTAIRTRTGPLFENQNAVVELNETLASLARGS